MGALVLDRKDDGTLEIMRADDEIEVDEHLLGDIPERGDYAFDGNALRIQASGTLLVYELVSYDRERHVYHFVRLQEV